jgi:hypothetical protein
MNSFACYSDPAPEFLIPLITDCILKFHFDTYYPSDVSFKGLIVMILANLNERQNVDITITTAISIEQMPLVEMPR